MTKILEFQNIHEKVFPKLLKFHLIFTRRSDPKAAKSKGL